MNDKNYYELLEVDKNASKEVLEKAYKTLVKKYHPDLQTPENKSIAEEKIKKINEAFEVLSDDVKRTEYDATLSNDYISKEEYDDLFNQNEQLKQDLNKAKYATNNTNTYKNNKINNDYAYNTINTETNNNLNNYDNLHTYNDLNLEYAQQQINNAVNKAYHDAYIQDLKNRGYKIKYQKSFKDYIRIFLVFIFLILLCFILWKIPFIQNYLISIYKDNEIIRFCVDFIKSFINELFHLD